RITIPTTTYVNVSDTSYHDTTDSLRDPPVFSAGEDVTIKANVTDPIGSYDIRYPGGSWNNSGANATVRYPNGSIVPGFQNKSMNLEIIDSSSPSAWKIFNLTVPAISLDQLGVYNVTVTGWESNGVYVQQDSNFSVTSSDSIPPQITNVTDVPDPQESGFNVNISADVTDDVGVGSVTVNITSPNGTTLGNFSMNYSSITDHAYFNRTYNTPGIYDYKIWARDLSNNWNSSSQYSFTIQDTIPPMIMDVSAAPAPQFAGGLVNITCNVTDNLNVSQVFVNITSPSTVNLGNFSMNETATDKFFFVRTYSELGTYSFFVWANDTNDNRNISVGHTFVIIGPNIPKITNVDAQPDPQVTGGFVNITCNVTDDIGVSEVWVNITAPSGTTLGNYSMNYSSITSLAYFNRTYTTIGTYDYTIWANDTSNNWNNSSGHTFLIYDSDLPKIQKVSATPSPQEVYGFVNISAEVSDNTGIHGAWVNITLPDGSELGNFSMNYSSTKKRAYFNRSYGEIGTYRYDIWANDTDNNWNYSTGHSFRIVDTQKPMVADNTVDIPTTGDMFTINASIIDNYEIDTVRLFYLTDVSPQNNISMIHTANDFYERSVLVPTDATVIYYNISANDASDNWNQTGEIKETVIDNDPPSITDNSASSAVSSEYFVINVTVTDNLDVDEVFACYHTNVTGWSNTSMVNTGGGHYELNVTLPEGAATLYYNITANDTSDNWNMLGTKSVDLPEDTSRPEEIVVVSGDEQEQTVGTTLNQPFVVRVLDGNGDPVGSDIEVWFNITTSGLNGDAELGKSSPVLTDENGSANVTLTLDSMEGENLVNASIKGTGSGRWALFDAMGVVPHFEAKKTVDRHSVDPGDGIVYTIYYNNTGSEPAANVWINDTLDSNLEYMGDDSGVSPILARQTLSWHLTDVDVGEHYFQINCRVKTGSEDETVIQNSFDIEYRDYAGNSYGNSSNVVESRVSSPVMTIGKSVSAERARANDELEYVVYFNNIGTGMARDVWVNDTLSRHLEYNNDSSGVAPRIIVDGEEKTYCWHFKNVEPGTYSFRINVTISSDTRDGSLISNLALLDYSTANGNFRPGLISNKVTTTVYTVVDNLPPTIEGVPDLIVHYDYDYSFNLSSYVSDPDNTSSELSVYFSDPVHVRVNESYHLGMILNYPKSLNGTTVELTIWVTDGITSDYQSIDVLVTNNFPPEIRKTLPDVTFYEDDDHYGFDITEYFFDRDKNALYYSSGEKYLNVTILENGTVLFKPPRDWYGVEVITFRATEVKISEITGALVEDTIIVTVLPVNDAPIIEEMPTQKGKADERWSLNLSSYLYDVDDPLSNLTLSVDSKYVTVSGHELVFEYPEGIPNDNVIVTVSDGKTESSRELSIKVAQPTLLEKIYWPWPIVPFLFLIPLIGFAYYRKTRIEQVFLIYGSGLLIAHESRSDENQMDEDIFSSMLSVIQDFVKDSFQEAENYGIKKLEFGDRKILVERGKNVFMAVLYSGRTSTPVESKMRDKLREIEIEYGDTLENWDGDLEKLKGVREDLKELF
ncbi:MAG: hypothetical protein R6U61_05520, partial [Thermoplasmata archaeon]